MAPAPARDRLRGPRRRADPPSRFDHTSLRILQPRLALAVWRGQRPFGRAVPIYNLFNRTPTPIERGWSVRKTQVRDFQGGALTYDSHNGTDFATAPGTVIVAPAAARVILVVSEFHRGGLKLLLDHGDGLATSCAHLARALVEPGQVVARGEPIALSGASGLNFVAALGADPPHLHFNVWLDGEPVDPFAVAGEASLAPRQRPHPGATDRDLPRRRSMTPASPPARRVPRSRPGGAAARDPRSGRARARHDLRAQLPADAVHGPCVAIRQPRRARPPPRPAICGHRLRAHPSAVAVR
ncbi:MAG: M23 family metallopeptidase [Myxococcales bacterium]|nr:M23 family metallopeptidase [Myxococcales bacterium]